MDADLLDADHNTTRLAEKAGKRSDWHTGRAGWEQEKEERKHETFFGAA